MRLPRSTQRHLAAVSVAVLLFGLSAAAASAATNKKSQQENTKSLSQRAESAAQVQPVAEKKQGDAALSASAAADLLNQEEYVQIKPEELSANDQGKEIDAVIAAAVAGANGLATGGQSSGVSQLPASGSAAAGGSDVAEHKSADEELNAHLAQDTIAQLESAYRPQAVAPLADPRTSGAPRPYGAPSRGYAPAAQSGPSASRYSMRPAPAPPSAQQQQSAYRAPRGPRMPPSYITLKGKLTGINSIINQYPHPAPGYPHQGPRHLPRGAAAGYAAFRDFVRAHASKYKNITPMVSYPAPMESHGPAEMSAGNGRYPSAGGKSYAAAGPPPPPPPPPAAPIAQYQPTGGEYGAAPPPHQATYTKSYRSQPSKTKVTVAQAYIPHLAPQAETGAAGYGASAKGASGYSANSSPMSPYTNPVLAKLYGGHAPQGIGRPEYSKDYGMVIHYPQATVYTEPMTVDKLHKLTGSGISSILEHLQYNLANGHRDEANMLRGNKQHHLGHGVTIHAKEYYAPGKGGHYVPTTAAVISTQKESGAYGPSAGYSGEQQVAPAAHGEQSGSGEAYGSQQATGASSAYGHESAGPSEHSAAPTLGSGYERVKQAAASSAQGGKYNSGPAKTSASQEAYGQQQASGYEQQQQQPSGSAKLYGNGEPLSAITSLIGSELESLYKANSHLNKHLEPEIHEQIQAYVKSGAYGNNALKYHDLDARSPLMLQQQQYQGEQSGGKYGAGPPQQHQHHGPPQQGPQYQQPQQQHGARGYGGPQKGHRAPRRGNKYGGHQGGHRQHHRNQHHQQQYQGNGHRQPQMYGQQQQYGRQHHQQQQGYGGRPNQAGGYMQQQAYKAAEQQLNQQMMQLLQDFHAGDEQYNGKNQPMHQTNQGYPHKVMQKYQQNQQPQQGYGQQQQQQGYPQQHAGPMDQHHEALEIPQGPNDQIGEISDLIEALKGTLESHNPGQYGGSEQHQQGAASPATGSYNPATGYKQSSATPAKLEDVHYLTSALGQAPSYSVQVPVAHEQTGSGHEGVKGYQQAPVAAAPLEAPSSYGQQQQQHQGYQAQPQQHQQVASGGYQQQQQQQQSAGYGQQQPQQTTGYGAQQQQAAGGDSYGQHQQQVAAVAAAVAAPSGYGQQDSSLAAAYGQHAALAGGAQFDAAAPVQSTGGYGAPAAAPASGNYGDYNPQQQQQQQQSDYSQQQQQQQQQNDYAQHQQQVASAGGYGSHSLAPVAPASGSYQQQEQLAAPQANGYSQSAEHATVINHLVPAVSAAPIQQVATSSHGYESASSQHHQQQPVNQIAIAAPNDAHVQQAQSLSSFVDSLPSDYQELLRQPALDGHGGSHLAALGQEVSSSNYGGQSSGGSHSAADSYQSAASSSLPTYSSSSSSSSSSSVSAIASALTSSPSKSSTKETSGAADTKSSSNSSNSASSAASSSSASTKSKKA